MQIAEAIHAVRRRLGDPSPATTTFTGALTATTTSANTNPVLQGKPSLLEVDGEVLSVASVTGATVTFGRGAGGTSPAAHASGVRVLVNPRYPTNDVREELKAELRRMEVEGFGRLLEASVSLVSTSRGYYDLSGLDVTSIHRVIGTWAGSEGEVRHRVEGDRLYLLDDWRPDGGVVTVHYRAPLVEFGDDTDDLSIDCGLPRTAQDIPILGAATKLFEAKAILRQDIQATAPSRSAEAVNPSEMRLTANRMAAERAIRVGDELRRLANQRPVRW